MSQVEKTKKEEENESETGKTGNVKLWLPLIETRDQKVMSVPSLISHLLVLSHSFLCLALPLVCYFLSVCLRENGKGEKGRASLPYSFSHVTRTPV